MTVRRGDGAADRGPPADRPGSHIDRLERLIHQPVSSRPDWLKYWQEEAQYLLFLAQRANSDDDIDALHDLDEEARMMADGMASRMRAEEGA